MDGITINPSLGKSKEELSSLTSEESVETAVVEETPVAETETKEPVAEAVGESQPPAAEEKVPDINEDLVRSKAKELGYFSQEDFDSQLETRRGEWEDSNKPQDESDFIKRARELEVQGYKIDDPNYWSLVTKDYSNYDLNDIDQALDVILQGYKLEHPNVSEDNLRSKIENDYDALYDEDVDPEDREHKRALSNLMVNAPTYLDKLKEKQSSAMPAMSEENQEKVNAELEQKRIQTFLPKAEREYKAKINKYLNENSSYDVKVGDDIIQYELSKSELGQLNEKFNDIFKKDYRLLIDENGSIENRVKDEGVAFTRENLIWMTPELRSGVLNKMLEHNSAQRDKEQVKELTNTTLPNTQAKANKTGDDVNAESWSKVSLPRVG